MARQFYFNGPQCVIDTPSCTTHKFRRRSTAASDFGGKVLGKYILQIVRLLLVATGAYALYYSYEVFSLKTGTTTYLLWILVAAFLFFCAFLMGNGRWGKIPLWIRKTAVILLVVAISLFIIIELLIVSRFQSKAKAGLDCVIVLGAQVFSSGPSVIYKQRLDAAYDYLVDNPNAICIVTGAQGSNEPISEGEGGRNYLIARGIDKSRVLAETESTNTRENIENAFEILKKARPDAARIGIATNNFHVFRGMFLARKITGLSVEGIAAPSVKRYLPTNMLREPLGIIKDTFFVIFE